MTAGQDKSCDSVPKQVVGLIDELLSAKKKIEERSNSRETNTDRLHHIDLLQRTSDMLRYLLGLQEAVFEAVPAHVAILDLSGNISWVNTAWKSFANENGLDGHHYGIGLNYLEACTNATFESTKEAFEVADGIESVLNNKSATFNAEYTCHSEKEDRWFRLTAKPILTPLPKGAVVAHINITGQRQAHLKIKQQAELLDKAHDAIMVRTLDDHLIYWNRGAERLYGWKAEEVLGRKAKEFLPHSSEAYESIRNKTIEYGSWTEDFVDVTKSGSKVIVQGNWTLVKDDSGKPSSILAIKTDVSEKRAYETRLLRAQRLESLGVLAGGIVHDLNNILTPVLMSIDLLRPQIDKQTALDVLDTIEFSTQRGVDILRQILSFAQGTEGKKNNVNLLYILKEIVKLLKETLPRNIAILVEAPSEPLYIPADSTQIHQVILNLAINARDAMPNGGTLTLKAERFAVDREYSTASPLGLASGAYIIISVSDTGSGIPQNIQDKIFDPFFTTKEAGKGTGLGLATVLQITTNHGGTVSFDTELNRGTTFKVYIPEALEPIQEISRQSAILSRGHGELILVVDDEEPVRSITKATLEEFGYKVILAANGAEAASLYVEFQPFIAAVITDLMMPIMDGSSLIHTLRKLNPAVKVLAVSGQSSVDSPLLMNSDVNHYLPKPHTAEKLMTALAIVLENDQR